MPDEDKLKEYKKKRDFEQTPEPSDESDQSKAPADYLFVIQKHAASRLHYDFRIEVGGVLKSWAVPKGPSTNPKDKRLAMPTEVHPMGYATFEGKIPEGSYGAGTVIVWDIGTYSNLKEKNGDEVPMEETVENGRIEIRLDGKKLKGGYALTRFKTGKDESWLLIKMNDEYADHEHDITKEHPESALSGRTIEEVANE